MLRMCQGLTEVLFYTYELKLYFPESTRRWMTRRK